MQRIGLVLAAGLVLSPMAVDAQQAAKMPTARPGCATYGQELPVVFSGVGDPIVIEIVPSLAKPGGPSLTARSSALLRLPGTKPSRTRLICGNQSFGIS